MANIIYPNNDVQASSQLDNQVQATTGGNSFVENVTNTWSRWCNYIWKDFGCMTWQELCTGNNENTATVLPNNDITGAIMYNENIV